LGADILYDREDIDPLVRFFGRYTAAGGKVLLAGPDRGVEKRAWEGLRRIGFRMEAHDIAFVQEGDRTHRVHIRQWVRA